MADGSLPPRVRAGRSQRCRGRNWRRRQARRRCPPAPCNPVQGATAFLASTATSALWNLQLTGSKGGTRVRIPLSPPNRISNDRRLRCEPSAAVRTRARRSGALRSHEIDGPSSPVPVCLSSNTWLRHLIRPRPGWALSYIDWSQQEFGIAAALSGDVNMCAAYASGAAPLPSQALLVGLVCWRWAGMRRSSTIRLSSRVVFPALGLSRFTVYRALQQLEHARLIVVRRRAAILRSSRSWTHGSRRRLRSGQWSETNGAVTAVGVSTDAAEAARSRRSWPPGRSSAGGCDAAGRAHFPREYHKMPHIGCRGESTNRCKWLVRKRGFEPPRPCGH